MPDMDLLCFFQTFYTWNGIKINLEQEKLIAEKSVFSTIIHYNK